MRAPLALAFLLGILGAVSCSSSDASGPGANDGGATDGATGEGGRRPGGGGTDPVDETCPYEGNYVLESYLCDASDVTASWKAAVPTTEAVVTTTTGGTGCAFQLTYESPTCRMSEAIEVTPPTGAAVAMLFHGIGACDPPACKFRFTDPECKGASPAEARTRTGSTTSEAAKVTLEVDREDEICAGPAKNRLVFVKK